MGLGRICTTYFHFGNYGMKNPTTGISQMEFNHSTWVFMKGELGFQLMSQNLKGPWPKDE
jgi:hypothetical protein